MRCDSQGFLLSLSLKSRCNRMKGLEQLLMCFGYLFELLPQLVTHATSVQAKWIKVV